MRDTLNDMQLYLVDEFVEEYQEGHLSRREALRAQTLLPVGDERKTRWCANLSTTP